MKPSEHLQSIPSGSLSTVMGTMWTFTDEHNNWPDLEEIAHSLAHQCRFGGHATSFYSVAEHSVRVSEMVPEHLQFQALMHDAHEAYIMDLPRPLKKLLPDYVDLEFRCACQVRKYYDLPDELHPIVTEADLHALEYEMARMQNSPVHPGEIFPPPHGQPMVEFWNPPTAKARFVQRFQELFPKRPRDAR